jgi:hypothetical protein
VAEPKAFRISRPYASVDEYLDAESWSIDAKGMILVGGTDLPESGVIRFEIVLQSGRKPIRAEGKIVRRVEPEEGKPAGVLVRFRRLDGPGKALVDRVLAERAASPAPEPKPAQASVPAEVAPEDRSGTHARVGPVAAPSNREELLERLRQRTRRANG